MTAKEFVKSRFPKARAEKQYAFAMIGKRAYYLIRNGDDYMYMASGETESKAWVNTKKMIEKNEIKP